jgi:hypothetical protein
MQVAKNCELQLLRESPKRHLFNKGPKDRVCFFVSLCVIDTGSTGARGPRFQPGNRLSIPKSQVSQPGNCLSTLNPQVAQPGHCRSLPNFEFPGFLFEGFATWESPVYSKFQGFATWRLPVYAQFPGFPTGNCLSIPNSQVSQPGNCLPIPNLGIACLPSALTLTLAVPAPCP